MPRFSPVSCPTLVALLVACLGGCGEAPRDAAPPADGPAASTPSELPSGRWRELPPRDSQDELLEALDALGYASGSRPAADATGVTVHDVDVVSPGYNLVVSGHGPEALLVDMGGEVVHRWAMPPSRAFPGRAGVDRASIQSFRRAHLLPDGDLLAIYEGFGLVRIGRDGALVWAHDGLAHHDLDVLPGGRIVVLERVQRMLPRLDAEKPVFDDVVTVLGPDGRGLSRTSIFDAFDAAGLVETYEQRLTDGLRRAWGDVFHTNTLQVVSGERAGWSPLVEPGDVVVSLRRLDLLAIVDLDATRMTWTASGPWRAQHQPELLPDGRMLLFDNRGRELHSTVLELDPQTLDVTWSYTHDAPYGFYSETCGSVQRLPNGHTLVVESDAGRAFELTREKTIVWEYRNPHRAGDDDEFVATLFDCVRVAPDAVDAWLGE